MKKEDVDRVVKEVNDNLRTDKEYPRNFVKLDYLKYGFFTISPGFSKTGKELVIK
jgi:hypothetical protein